MKNFWVWNYYSKWSYIRWTWTWKNYISHQALYNNSEILIKVNRVTWMKYVKTVYNMMLRDCDIYTEKTNWMFLLKNLVSSFGFCDVWINEGVNGDSKLIMYAMKQRLKIQFIQNWRSRLELSSCALFYKNICTFRFHSYIIIILMFPNFVKRLWKFKFLRIGCT